MATDCGTSHQPAMASVHGSFKPRLLACHSIAGAMDASERSVPDTPLGDVTSTPVKPTPIKWYSRSALDEFRTTAASERARFEETIADAHARLARARAAVGLHQTMMDMLLGSQREIREIRRAAEVEAAAIIQRGEDEADAILRTAGSAQARGESGDDSPAHAATADNRLTPLVEPQGNGHSDAQDDDFFTYLKGTLGKDDRFGSLHDE